MPAERVACVKPGHYQVSLSVGQQAQGAPAPATSQRAIAFGDSPASRSPPPAVTLLSAGHDGGGQAPVAHASAQHQRAAPTRAIWQPAMQPAQPSSPSCSSTPRRATPPRTSSFSMSGGIGFGGSNVDAFVRSGSCSLSPARPAGGISAAGSPRTPELGGGSCSLSPARTACAVRSPRTPELGGGSLSVIASQRAAPIVVKSSGRDLTPPSHIPRQQPTAAAAGRSILRPAPEEVPPWRSSGSPLAVHVASPRGGASASTASAVFRQRPIASERSSPMVHDAPEGVERKKREEEHKNNDDGLRKQEVEVHQPVARKVHKGLGARGLPERMWSQPAPPVHSPMSFADSLSAPQSPRHSPSSPSFPRRNSAAERRGISEKERQRQGGRNASAASSQQPAVLASPRGRAAGDAAVQSQTPRERAPSVDSRHRDGAHGEREASKPGPCQEEPSPHRGDRGERGAPHGESSREALRGARGERTGAGDSSSSSRQLGGSHATSDRWKAPPRTKEQAKAPDDGEERRDIAAEVCEPSGEHKDRERDSTTHRDRRHELVVLRATLECERGERQKLEAMSEDAAGRLAKGETYLGTLSWELQEVSSQWDSIRRQLKEKSEKHGDLLRKVRREHEHRQELEGDLAQVAMIRRDLESRMQKDHGDKLSADLLVKDLQQRLRQFEKDMAAAVGLKRRAAEELPEGLQTQLEQLRNQLEDTVKVVQNRYGSPPGDAIEANEKPASGHAVGAGSSAVQSNTHLSLLETTSPCSSRSLEAVAVVPSSVEELPAAGEEELPAEERLIGEWSSVSQEAFDQLPTGDHAVLGQDEKAAGFTRVTSASSLSDQSTGSGGPAAPPSPELPSTAPRSSSATPPLLPGDDDRTCLGESPMERAVSNGSDEAVGILAPTSSRRSGNVLSLRDLSEIKTLKKPPPPIRMLMEVCCLLFHIKPTKHADEKNPKRWCHDYWEPARRYLLSDPFFPAKLRMYEASHISGAQRTRIRRYFRDPEFSADRVRNCSKAAFELYDWVLNLVESGASRPPEVPEGDGPTLASTDVQRQRSDGVPGPPC